MTHARQMQKLPGWRTFRAEPDLLQTTFDLDVQREDSAEIFSLKIGSGLMDWPVGFPKLTVVGWYEKIQKGANAPTMLLLNLPEAPVPNDLMAVRGDVFGFDTFQDQLVSAINASLSRDSDGGYMVSIELFVRNSDDSCDVWVLSSLLTDFKSMLFEFSGLHESETNLLWGLNSEAFDELDEPSCIQNRSKTERTTWSFGTSNHNLAFLGVDIEVGKEVSTAPWSPKPLVSLTSSIAKIEFFRSENPSQLRVERKLAESLESEFATLSAGPPAASFICACLAPVRVNNGLMHSLFGLEDENTPPITHFDLVICPEFASGDDKRYSIDNDGVRVKHLRDGQMVELSVHPMKLYDDLLQCLTSEQV